MSKQFTLGKKERLKSRKQIEQLFSEGQRFVLSPFRVFYISQPAVLDEKSRLQLGVGVSSRFFKKAVDRNRVKRLVREAWRLQKKDLEEKLREDKMQTTVFFIYTGRELPDYKTVSDKTKTILQKLLEKIN